MNVPMPSTPIIFTCFVRRLMETFIMQRIHPTSAYPVTMLEIAWLVTAQQFKDLEFIRMLSELFLILNDTRIRL